MRPDANAAWQLDPAPTRARLWLAALAVVLPLVIAGTALGVSVASGEERDLVADSLALTIAGTLAAIVLIGGGVALVVARAMRRHHVVLDTDGIEVATTFYTRRLAWGELRLDEARVVDLDEHTQLKPLWKTNGAALPGFRSGWFRLRNREKALVAMIGGPRVTWVPTTRGFGLMLQPRQPQALLDQLRRLAPRR